MWHLVQGFRGLDSVVGVLHWQHCFRDGGVEVKAEADDSVVSCCVGFGAADAESGSLSIEGDVREEDRDCWLAIL